MAKDVACEVSNCRHWKDGNKCDADKIYVVSQIGEHASNHQETDCKTFEIM